MLSSMAADRARILSLDTAILDIEHSLPALRAERSLVQGRLDAYTYPVLTLSNEITSEIFTHFLPPYPETPPFAGIDSPISLTHVCRQWRSVAIATPALWRAIEFDTPQLELPSKQICRLFEDLMMRSGSLPLSIWITSNDAYFLHQIFTESAKMGSARWEYLEVIFLAPLRLPKIGCPIAMPMVRSLTLSASESSSDDSVEFDVPLLRTLTLDGSVISKLIFPWEHLTSLTLERVSVDECFRILPRTLNLTRCTLVFHNDGENRLDDIPWLKLPCLESLVLEDRSREQTSVIVLVEALIVPALQKLTLDEKILEDHEDLIRTLEYVISRSKCKIQNLHITRSSMTREFYRRAFPTIPTLSLSMYADDDFTYESSL